MAILFHHTLTLAYSMKVGVSYCTSVVLFISSTTPSLPMWDTCFPVTVNFILIINILAKNTSTTVAIQTGIIINAHTLLCNGELMSQTDMLDFTHFLGILGIDEHKFTKLELKEGR